VKTAWCYIYLYSSGYGTSVWQTDRQTERPTDGQTELLWLIQRSALQAMRPCCNNLHFVNGLWFWKIIVRVFSKEMDKWSSLTESQWLGLAVHWREWWPLGDHSWRSTKFHRVTELWLQVRMYNQALKSWILLWFRSVLLLNNFIFDWYHYNLLPAFLPQNTTGYKLQYCKAKDLRLLCHESN